jgi:hypothetical protein
MSYKFPSCEQLFLVQGATRQQIVGVFVRCTLNNRTLFVLPTNYIYLSILVGSPVFPWYYNTTLFGIFFYVQAYKLRVMIDIEGPMS